MAKKKPKWEKLSISCLRRGEVQYETAYNAPEAARKATKRAKAGWSCKITKSGSGSYSDKRKPVAFMTCEPSANPSVHDYGPHRKTFAKCSMTPAFKKRVTRR